MSRDWKVAATKAAYGCFLIVGAIQITYLLVGCLGDTSSSLGEILDSYFWGLLGAPLTGFAIVAAVAGIALALILWQEWPLLPMAVLSVTPVLVRFGVIRWPSACSNFWTSGICLSVVMAMSGLVLLSISLRFFLFKKGSSKGHRLVLIGLVASALWAVFIMALNSAHIRSAATVLRTVFNKLPSDLTGEQANQVIKEASKASQHLENLVGLLILAPLAWMAFAVLQGSVGRRAQARAPVSAPSRRGVQERAGESADMVEGAAKRHWRSWAKKAAYGCFLAVGAIEIALVLISLVPLGEGCSAYLGFFGLFPLMSLLPVLTIVGLALALILWREWPLLVMSVISVISHLVSFPRLPLLGKIPLPSVCTDPWTSGLCPGVVGTVSGLVLLFFSLRFFLSSKASRS